jgi:ABC-type Mn2+/Zn2+ transport system permease subunit
MMDLINGCFELFGSGFLLKNVFRLHRDKKLAGVTWEPVALFTLWGWWNLFYYPSFDQWFSFAGGLAIVLVNMIWLGQVAYYRHRQQQIDYMKGGRYGKHHPGN